MKLETLDIHSNQITTEGFYRLMVCLKANNKVKTLNISKNKIADDLKMFKQVHKFLNCNKVLENLDMSFCDINVKAAQLIGGGLRGNRSLQKLDLKGNIIREGIINIAKSFVENTKALCIKELDISKCQIESEHITQEFTDMIKSQFCTLKSIGLRDNFIK